ncbi:hypothetical protein H8356DRAFT_1348611 [Neocallimastix lanati (nom. inval.)]|nr:hypothetical protein H8356DRAFT_1348611 [Neocallimastix sp. JGI-2020a]
MQALLFCSLEDKKKRYINYGQVKVEEEEDTSLLNSNDINFKNNLNKVIDLSHHGYPSPNMAIQLLINCKVMKLLA